MKLRLYDIFDRMIGNKIEGENTTTLDLNLLSGVYFYILTIDNKIVFKDIKKYCFILFYP
jgi:hypothetical protein